MSDRIKKVTEDSAQLISENNRDPPLLEHTKQEGKHGVDPHWSRPHQLCTHRLTAFGSLTSPILSDLVTLNCTFYRESRMKPS